MFILVAVLASTLTQSQTATSPLRIVVLEGEDAVNVIQQKTAVRPVIEVRDRNNLPVPGVTVTFAIQGNAATFAGGASTFSVMTNAAGQAAASALNPVASGALQVQVQAALQGQTAVATITQTNVLTAAQAAGAAGGSGGASSTGSAGAGGGSGGGLSGPAIGGIAAAGAGAVALATLRKSEEAVSRITANVVPGLSGITNVTEFVFTASGGDAAGSFNWDFGDGSTAPGATARHVFGRDGQFTVTLRSDGASPQTSTLVVSVKSMTGTWRYTHSGGTITVTLAQVGTDLVGEMLVESSVPPNYRSLSPVTGRLTSPFGIALTQGGECNRVLAGGQVSPRVDSISGEEIFNNPVCPGPPNPRMVFVRQ